MEELGKSHLKVPSMSIPNFRPILPRLWLAAAPLAGAAIQPNIEPAEMRLAETVAHTSRASSTVVGFQTRTMDDGTEIVFWYPAYGEPQRQRVGLYEQIVLSNAAPVGEKMPFVVMSHGSGGSFADHYDVAAALVKSGFVVAALTHPGDNWRDKSRSADIAARPIALSRLIDFSLGSWEHRNVIDPQSIGAFGFSSGAFTALTAAGGKPDLTKITSHCAEHPDFYDCKLVSLHKPTSSMWPNAKDKRIKAIVVAAPALGYMFDRKGLRSVKVPVQLWRADRDQILPAPYYADAVLAALPKKPEFQNVVGAGHFDFLAPCAAGGQQAPVCKSAPDFDRVKFHADFSDQVAGFFNRTLRR